MILRCVQSSLKRLPCWQKWNGLIIEVLLHEHTQRFKDLARTLINQRSGALRAFKELEEDGIVSRNTYPGESRVDYSLTERGRDLAPVMEAVHEWSNQWCGKG